MNDFEKAVRDLKEKEDLDPLYKACCDILRALVILHGSAWHSELTEIVAELWALKDLTPEEESILREKLPEALNFMNSQAIVDSRRRLRASLSGKGASEEMLHTVRDSLTLLRILGGDRQVGRYRWEAMGYSGIKLTNERD